MSSSTASSYPLGSHDRPSGQSPEQYNALMRESRRYVPGTLTTPPLSPSSPISSKKKRNSTLHKPQPRSRNNIIDQDPFASISQPANMASSPPTRPSRANTVTLNDLYSPQSPLDKHYISSPITAHEPSFYADPVESTPPVASTSSSSPNNQLRRNGTTKGRKGMLGFMSDFLGSNKHIAISTPYDPVHLTHVGFNSTTGEFTGLPKEWQQLLQDSGISRIEQEKNPQAVMEIVKFYQEGSGRDVWDKMGTIAAPLRKPSHEDVGNPVSFNSYLDTSVSYARIYIAAYRATASQEISRSCAFCLSTSARATLDCYSLTRSFHFGTPSFCQGSNTVRC
jgi:p21-activated kinase 1